MRRPHPQSQTGMRSRLPVRDLRGRTSARRASTGGDCRDLWLHPVPSPARRCRTMKLTDEQLAFARSMSERQWAVLARLGDGVWCLSASERCDPELYALIRGGWAAVSYAVPPTVDRGLMLPQWEATDRGRELLNRRRAARL
jgi:hypothetical protein